MIELSVPTLFLFPLCILSGLLLIVWAIYSLRGGSIHFRARQITRIYRCENCQHPYIDHREVPATRCPRCGALNDAFQN